MEQKARTRRKDLAPLLRMPSSPLAAHARKHTSSDGRQFTLLKSHHQYYSAFEDWFTKPARQLAEFIRRPVLWFWGHEHRMAAYGEHSFEEGIRAHGRCIGHGGMPVEFAPVTHPTCPPILYDGRRYPTDEQIEVGYNGLLRLTIVGNRLRADYRDLHDHQVLLEEWEVTGGLLRRSVLHESRAPGVERGVPTASPSAGRTTR